jgi:hypothetical protein
MVRKFACLLAALVATLGMTVFSTGTASALGTPSFGCRVAPGTEFNFYQTCSNTRSASAYSVAFKVENTSASTTYSWTIPAYYQSRITNGCTSTSSSCTMSAPSWEQEINVDVAFNDGGTSGYLSSTANIVQYCSWGIC